MEKLLNQEVQDQLRSIFSELKNNLRIVLFTSEENCETCGDTLELITEISALSDKITLTTYDLKKDAAEAAKYDVTLSPSFVLLDKDDQYKGVKFNGIPAGHEINSFISALLEMSGAESEVPQNLVERIAKIDKPVNIKVFVTLSCPHCPGAVQKAHKLAMMNKNIVGEMIEAQTFYELSEKFNVSGVPKIIINDELELVGNQPIERFLEQIEAL